MVAFPRKFEAYALGLAGAEGWEEVYEISYFLAVESYPARAAREPQVSFETHCWSVYTELESQRPN
ncbi:MAG: hypothetical protein DMG83_15265 [Acidobacteria bacterium]|nr:MAG: hypothetical protein DMG83_15265 [Acidobacteriota bacterium]